LDDIRIPPRIIDGDFAGWLRDAMASRRLSARVVGMRTGINHSTITRLLHGGREPTLATVVALLRLFGGEPPDERAKTNGAETRGWPTDVSVL
jgi:transcriptional regulator with XRE-family HTH domain